MTKLNYTLDGLSEVAAQIIEQASCKTLLFYGEMGVGKTTLIKALVKQLGSDDTVSSPTFSVVNEYDSKNGPIFHFDFYRIEDEFEAMDIGLEEYLESGNWVFIEWPGKIESLLPDEHQKIKINKNNHIRNLTLD